MPKTVVGLFTDERGAQRAVSELLRSGVAREDIGITSRNYGGASGADMSGADEGLGEKISNFFGSLFGADDERIGHLTEAVRGGGQQSRAAMSEGGKTVMSEGGETVLPVVEEELQVGKREVESGGVRVRSHVIERPVEESVRLREERVSVERRPANRPVTDADARAIKGGDIEVTERSEEAVVAKRARVVEEVVVNKEVVERDEAVRDTVRRTEVEVEKIEGDKKGAGRKNR